MGDSKRDCWTLGTESLNQIEKQAESGWSKVFFHHPKSRRLAWPKQLVLECAENPVSGPMLAGSRYYGKLDFPRFSIKAGDRMVSSPMGMSSGPKKTETISVWKSCCSRLRRMRPLSAIGNGSH
jgi:hypothetical protein